VQVTEQQVILSKMLQVPRDRFLDLDDQPGLAIGCLRVGTNSGACGNVLVIGISGQDAGIMFDNTLVTRVRQHMASIRAQCYPALQRLDLAWNAYPHGFTLSLMFRTIRFSLAPYPDHTG
jgi:hypothetical protein